MRWLNIAFTIVEISERLIRIVHIAAELLTEVASSVHRQEDDPTEDQTE